MMVMTTIIFYQDDDGDGDDVDDVNVHGDVGDDNSGV